MGARQVPSAINAKIVANIALGKTATETAKLYGVSDTYCHKLMLCVKYVSAKDWEGLLEYSKTNTTRVVIDWACDYLSTPMPPDIAKRLEEVCYRYRPSAKVDNEADNTATAIVKLLEKLDAAVSAITAAADDICQTNATSRKLLEDCINANFDVLNGTVRDGFESTKTTIRKEARK